MFFLYYSVTFGMPVISMGAKDARAPEELAGLTIMGAEHDLPAATARDPNLVFMAASAYVQKVTVLVEGFQSYRTWKYANGHRALIERDPRLCLTPGQACSMNQEATFSTIRKVNSTMETRKDHIFAMTTPRILLLLKFTEWCLLLERQNLHPEILPQPVFRNLMQ
jgi:hypothetical protein